MDPEALTRCLLQWCRPAVAPDAVRGSLLALRGLLQSHDTEAADHLARHAPLLAAALGTQLDALARDVQGYAFEAALARVDALLAAAPA